MNPAFSTEPDAGPTEPVRDLNIELRSTKPAAMVTELVKVLK